MKSLKLVMLALGLLLSLGIMSDDKERQVLSYQELTMSKHDVNTFVFYDELSMMGDFGEGGGVGKKWWKLFRDNIYRRILSIGDFDIRLVDGNQYYLNKSKMPIEQYRRLELKPIKNYYTKDSWYSSDEVYAYYVAPDTDIHKPIKMKQLSALELMDGSIILKEEILAVTVELMIDESR